MDNKKWYDRIATCFWLFLATLPLWVALFGFIGQYLGHIPETYQGNTEFTSTSHFYNAFSYYLNDSTQYFKGFTPTFLNDMYENLFDLIDTNMSVIFGYILSWFTWVFFMHLLADFITWLPKFFHKLLSKGVDLK